MSRQCIINPQKHQDVAKFRCRYTEKVYTRIAELSNLVAGDAGGSLTSVPIRRLVFEAAGLARCALYSWSVVPPSTTSSMSMSCQSSGCP